MQDAESTPLSRRALGRGAIAVAATGLGGWWSYDRFVAPTTLGNLARNLLAGNVDTNPEGPIPDITPVPTSYTVRPSVARGQDVGWFTAIPPRAETDAPLPIVVILHGASATASKFDGFGFGQFLAAATAAGTPPFALVGADGGRSGWQGGGLGSSDDPQTLIWKEIPEWCAELGLDTNRIAVWGWSMGGAGALSYTMSPTGFPPVATAAFSPAIGSFSSEDVQRLATTPLGLWCGLQDSLIEPVQHLAQQLNEIGHPPQIARWAPGSHTRRLWNTFTLPAFDFLGRALQKAAQ